MHRQIEDKDKSNTWKWLRKNDLKGGDQALIFSAQEQALRTNYMEFHVDKNHAYIECVEQKMRRYHIL